MFHIHRHAAEEQRLQTSSEIPRFRSIIWLCDLTVSSNIQGQEDLDFNDAFSVARKAERCVFHVIAGFGLLATKLRLSSLDPADSRLRKIRRKFWQSNNEQPGGVKEDHCDCEQHICVRL